MVQGMSFHPPEGIIVAQLAICNLSWQATNVVSTPRVRRGLVDIVAHEGEHGKISVRRAIQPVPGVEWRPRAVGEVLVGLEAEANSLMPRLGSPLCS